MLIFSMSFQYAGQGGKKAERCEPRAVSQLVVSTTSRSIGSSSQGHRVVPSSCHQHLRCPSVARLPSIHVARSQSQAASPRPPPRTHDRFRKSNLRNGRVAEAAR
jgi:hypothetical protein